VTTEDIFARVVGALDRAAIPYMLTGSFASSYHGMPRATQDIDIVIAPTTDQLEAFVRLLPPDAYYVNLDAALDAHRLETQFNIVDLVTGWKVDLIVRKSRAFSRTEFERRQLVEIEGLPLYVASAEDVIVAKLEWAKASQSSRQIDDVAGILRLRPTDLDLAYIAYWVGDLGLEQEWAAARRQAV
jgi:hypothetical protein